VLDNLVVPKSADSASYYLKRLENGLGVEVTRFETVDTSGPSASFGLLHWLI
jgi:hypothetical protein